MDAKYDLPGAGQMPRAAPGPGGGGGGGGGSMFGNMDPSALANAAAKNPKIAGYLADLLAFQKIFNCW